MDWRQHLHVATSAVRRGMISDAVLVDALGELARRLAVSADELWIRSRRLTTAQLDELLRLQAGNAATRAEHLVPEIPPQPAVPPQPPLAPGAPNEAELGGLVKLPKPPKAGAPSVATKDPDFEPEPPSSRFMSEAPTRRERYSVKHELGVGGMGRVIECQDHELGRRIALKAVRPDLRDKKGMADHLEREARLTARLEHPNIIPVYDAGRKTGIGPYYVMQLVRQPSLETVLERLRAKDPEATREYGLGRLLRAFIQVCHAIEYAHDRGIVHCDLKPANILLGDFGEVLIVDWGMALAKNDKMLLRGGTPGYMAPEQFLDDRTKIDARTDVFALGAILYEMTCLTPAFDADQVEEMTGAGSHAGPKAFHVIAPSVRSPSRARDALDEICMTALATKASARYTSARALGKAIEAFVEGTKERERRRRRAEQQADAGEELARSYFDLLDSRPERIAELEQLRAAIAPHEGVERKRELWDAEDRLSVTDRIAVRTLQTAVASYEQALEGISDHARARKGLFELYRRELDRAKARRNDHDRAYFEWLVRQYRDPGSPDVVDGTGSATLRSSASSVFVVVQRFEVVDRRLVGKDVARGDTPVVCKQLASGTYVALVGRERPTRHPFVVVPGADLEVVIDPVAVAETAPGEVYVPGGPALLTLGAGELREVDVPSFYLQARPVTFAEYLAFLTELVKTDRDAVDDHLPCNGDGEPYWEWSGDKFLRASAGMLGAAHAEIITWPVFGVTLRSAEAYAAWHSARTGKDYRLPSEAEWEKAARGIDGRAYPWGDAFDATLCKMRESRAGRARPERPGSFRVDESPYGALDMAGGVADWTAIAAPPRPSDPPSPAQATHATHATHATQAAHAGPTDATRVAVKGGAWCDWAADCELGVRRLYWTGERAARVGFRLARTAAARPAPT